MSQGREVLPLLPWLYQELLLSLSHIFDFSMSLISCGQTQIMDHRQMDAWLYSTPCSLYRAGHTPSQGTVSLWSQSESFHTSHPYSLGKISCP